MKLVIVKTDSTEYNLSDNFKTLGLSRGSVTREFELIERSALDGAQITGERRTASTQLSLTVQVNQSTDTAYRTIVNDLFEALTEAEYLKDTDNDLRTEIEFISINERHDDEVGSILRGGIYTIDLKQLTPYWEDNTENSETDYGVNPIVTINNAGALPVEPIIELSVDGSPIELCPAFAVYVDSTKEGIEIEDNSFGFDTTLADYTIDCVAGEALLGDDLINRNNRIKTNTGFFSIPTGSQDVECIADVAIDITVKWRNRYLI